MNIYSYIYTQICIMLGLDDEIKISSIEDKTTVAFCLTLPGRKLYLQPLLAMKTFRNRGNKTGAITAFYKLEDAKLGKVLEITNSKGTTTVNKWLQIYTYAYKLCVHVNTGT